MRLIYLRLLASGALIAALLVSVTVHADAGRVRDPAQAAPCVRPPGVSSPCDPLPLGTTQEPRR